MYADIETAAMRSALGATNRRRADPEQYKPRPRPSRGEDRQGASPTSPSFLQLEARSPKGHAADGAARDGVSPEEIERIGVELRRRCSRRRGPALRVRRQAARRDPDLGPRVERDGTGGGRVDDAAQ